MRLQRADRLTSPPVVGQVYLVPAILWAYRHMRRKLWWPVIGPLHDDADCFAFAAKHYHLDPRFFTRTHWAPMSTRRGLGDEGKMVDALSGVLNHVSMPDGPPKPQLRRIRCTRDTIAYPPYAAGAIQVRCINNRFAGTQCNRGKRGWVCPHRKVALGSVAPIDGVITCFLHGLRIDAETGVCLGPAGGGR